MKKIFFFLSLGLLSNFSFAQITFRHTFGGNYNDNCRSVIQTFDEGYIIAGSTGSFGYGNSDVYVIKLDSLGKKQWSNVYGGANVEWGYNIVQTYDSNYAIAGITSSFGAGGYDAYLIKIDTYGNLIWQKNIGGADWDFTYSLQQTNDSGFILAGETYSFGNGNNDAYLIKTDENGNFLWSKTYGGTKNDYAKSVRQTFDGGYILTGGTTSFGAGMNDVYVIKTNADGDTVWTKTFGDTLDDWGNDVVQKFDSGYVIVTSEETTNDTVIWKQGGIINVSAISNSIIWKQNFGEQKNDTELLNIKQHANKNFAVSGYAVLSFAGGAKDFLFIMQHIDGSSIHLGTYGGFYDDIGYSVDICKDNGYVIGGSTKSFGAGYADMMIVKTDSLGFPITSDFTSYADTVYTNQPHIDTFNSFNIYPNPANDFIHINYNGENHTNKKIQFLIYNLVGQKIIELNNISSFPLHINTGNFQNGVYFYKIIYNGFNEINGKIILSR